MYICFLDVNKKEKKMREVAVTEEGEKVKVQVLEEGNVAPLQDVSTEDFLKEMGFDMVPILDPSPSPSLGTFQALHLEQYLCPVHHEDMRQHTSRNGWLYWRCPTTNCFVMTGIQEAKEYFPTVGCKLIHYYQDNWNKLSCFCCKPLVLCQSCSEKNPGRIYFKCKGKQCNFFQWGDETLSPKNRQWLEGSGDEVNGGYSSHEKNGYPRRGYDCAPTYPPGNEKEYSG